MLMTFKNIRCKYERMMAMQSDLVLRILKYIVCMLHQVGNEFHTFQDLNCQTYHYVYASVSMEVHESVSI